VREGTSLYVPLEVTRMEVVVRGRDIELTDALKNHVSRKVRKLDKFLAGAGQAQVRLAVERGRHIAEVTIPVGGFILRGEVRGDDMYASVDQAVQKLERQAKRLNDRLHRHGIGAEAAAAGEDDQVSAAEEPEGVLVRTKTFPRKPMSPDEAILQMNLVSHDFFAFTNAETNAINVVYRRADGNYGLLEPEG